MDSDDAVLAGLGYKQEFKREFSMVETFGLSFSYVGLVPSMAYVSLVLTKEGGDGADKGRATAQSSYMLSPTVVQSQWSGEWVFHQLKLAMCSNTGP